MTDTPETRLAQAEKLKYCADCGAPMGPNGMVRTCDISGELCVECCPHCEEEL